MSNGLLWDLLLQDNNTTGQISDTALVGICRKTDPAIEPNYIQHGSYMVE